MALLVDARERAKSGNRLFDAFAAPPPVREPQRVVRMMRTRRPRGVNEGVMVILLDVIDDMIHVPDGIDDMQPVMGGGFNNWLIVAWADSRLHVRTNQGNDAILIFGGHSTRRLESVALYRARLTGRHAFFHDQMIAAEEAAADGTQAPVSHGHAATLRAVELEWTVEHFVGPATKSDRQQPLAMPHAVSGRISKERSTKKGMPYAAVQENSKFSGLHAPATTF